MNIDEQRRAVLYAAKEAQRELIKAKESGRAEWVAEVEKQIASLNAAAETLELVKSLRKLVA